MGKLIDEISNRYGRLIVLARAENNKHRQVIWLCQCDCGSDPFPVSGCNLKSGNTQSCGCYRKEVTSESHKGVPLSKEHCKKISESTKKGEDSPNWNPNLTNEERQNQRHIPGYNDWRTAVYERDLFTCQYCGDDTGGNLIAHHIESYDNNPELRIEISNGITFCETHHEDFHHQYGYGNNTREQLEEFLGGRII